MIRSTILLGALRAQRVCLVSLSAVASIGLLPATVSAQLDGPLVIRGNDTDAGDLFGASVDINNRVIIVGAYGDAPNGSFSGSAYLFDADTRAQLHKLIPSDGSAQDQFGTSVSISGNRAIVGAPNANKVYVFDVQTGQQLRVIQGPGAFGFGEGVDLDGTTAIIGSPFTNGFQGAAYLYDIESGQQLFTFNGNGGNFGIAVSIDGDRAAVGAPNGVNEVMLYEVSTGASIATLTSAGAGGFGEDVDIQFGKIVVGAPGTDVSGSVIGRVVVFAADSGAVLAGTPGSSFANGGTVAASSSGFHATGSELDPGQGIGSGQSTLISYNPSLAVVASRFLLNEASGMAADDEFVVVGQQQDDNNGANAGAVYIYTDPQVLALRFTSQPVGAVVSEGDQTAFSVSVNRTGADFQWRRNGVELSDGGTISGAQSDTLTIADVSDADIAGYDCVVSASGTDPVTSNPAVLAVLPDPCRADFNGDGSLDFFDITTYLGEYSDGCP